MRLKERPTEAISRAPRCGNSSAEMSPRLNRSATRAICLTGRTTKPYSTPLTIRNTAVNTAINEIMTARNARSAFAVARAKGTETTWAPTISLLCQPKPLLAP